MSSGPMASGPAAIGIIAGLHRTPSRRGDLEPLEVATVVADLGLEGDHHARPGSSRQVVLVEAEVLDALGLPPGAIREQLCVRGLTGLSAGDVLTIGNVTLEVVKPRVPCARMNEVRPGLSRELAGRAGWCTRAITGGRIAVGDTVSAGRSNDPQWLRDFMAALATYEAAPPPPDEPGGGLREELAHFAEWNERGVARLDALAAGAPDEHWSTDRQDAINAASIARLAAPTTTTSELYRLHDLSATAVIDAARRHGELARGWVASLALHYREHAMARPG